MIATEQPTTYEPQSNTIIDENNPVNDTLTSINEILHNNTTQATFDNASDENIENETKECDGSLLEQISVSGVLDSETDFTENVMNDKLNNYFQCTTNDEDITTRNCDDLNIIDNLSDSRISDINVCDDEKVDGDGTSNELNNDLKKTLITSYDDCSLESELLYQTNSTSTMPEDKTTVIVNNVLSHTPEASFAMPSMACPEEVSDTHVAVFSTVSMSAASSFESLQFSDTSSPSTARKALASQIPSGEYGKGIYCASCCILV